MKTILLVLFVSLFICNALCKTTWDKLSKNYTFEHYKREFGKHYASKEEENLRRIVFNIRLSKILFHNADTTKTWKEGVNHLTDRTESELNAMKGFDKALGYAKKIPEGYNLQYMPKDVPELPVTVDWRTKGIISPVKDQGQCGSCWTFGSTEAIESYYALKYGIGYLTDLSEQQALDCTPNPNDCGGTGGCGGGTAELVYAQMMKTGMTTEWQYSYNSYFGAAYQCRFNQTTPYAFLTNYTVLPSNQYLPVMNSIADVGPLAINVMASTWSDYESGVFDGCPSTNIDIDHVVLLIGYGVDPTGGAYWLVRNSWSPKWGEDGYIKLKRHTSTTPCGIDYTPQDGIGCNGGPSQVTVCGTCGVLYDTSFPIIR
jgi:cathepsin L